MKRRLFCALGLLLPWLATAEPVSIEHQGVKLNSELRLAEGKQLADGVVVLLHGTIAHHRMEIITALEQALNDRGLNTLAVNLGYNISDRAGMLPCEVKHTHRHEDAVAELNLWLEWLKSRGAGEVVLAGHSRAGNQVMWFDAEHPKASGAKIVLIAPMTWDAAEDGKALEARGAKSTAALLQQARDKVKAGQGGETLKDVPFIYCEKAEASADAIISYHGDDPRKHTPNLLKATEKQVLVITGTDDPLTAKLQPGLSALGDSKTVRVESVNGADHFFRDLYAEDVADLIVGFLR
ncbi:MAG: alpha/beta hydrolase [Thiotrichales bacterium]